MAPSYHGLLVLDKPAGMTSRAVVDRVQRWFPRGTRLGHTGTLDPLATGVLVVCVGAATRLAEYVQDMSKVYRAGVYLGARSDSDDADGTLTPVAAVPPPLERIDDELRGFHGEIEQTPPAFSAAHVAGRRAYELARRGEAVSLEPRRVRIYEIRILHYAYPKLELTVQCGKGTYIRSLARDLGERLGCGAYIESLRRERVGSFTAEESLSVNVDEAEARERIHPLATAVAELPQVTATADENVRLRNGQAIPYANLPAAANEVAVFEVNGTLTSIARIDRERRLLRPLKVLPDVVHGSPTLQ
jgi:tRNA pseudouridine55 synthase